ncbi:signal transduction histidine kinase [Flavobacterium arsenatis]|uniref:histidine kinase n=1 Tax=Flavobacterium arsenatis TaxID=1484332 RepID=A0ABU1TQK4_9FLAO|nr:HAMP domain-containing sensor histidine kinase [Flavobacterium arsenatis]MDR6968260.1 signal transduction histidine kinase [Flavobacterium arsenatis]
MKLYKNLSKIQFLKKSYVAKFLFVAFLGIHIPLIGLIIFILYFNDSCSPTTIFILTLVLTLLATAITLLILKKLMKPMEVMSKALDNYRNIKIIPNLPQEFSDEAGKLMINIQSTIDENENLLQAKQDLIYLLSHDLKNYIDNASSLAKVISEEDVSAITKNYANLIVENTHKQTAFIDKFINFLNEEDKIIKQDIGVIKIDFNEIVTSLEEHFAQKLINKKLELIVEKNIDYANLKVDKELLMRVLTNLIGNAIKFSFPESRIALSFQKQDQHLKIAVQDNGIGFENSKSELLFEKFTKMSRRGTLDEKSTGIGLYLSKQIIKKFEGSFTAQSEGINTGSRFTVSLKINE